jgi:Flp pilus assembly protein TadD
MGPLAESADWAKVDPDLAAAKQAMMGGDWNRAITLLRSAGLRDDRNADIQNYLGFAHWKIWQLDIAVRHYQQALTLNPRHRSAHEHLGEAYLAKGNLAKAEDQLALLKQIASFPAKNLMI